MSDQPDTTAERPAEQAGPTVDVQAIERQIEQRLLERFRRGEIGGVSRWRMSADQDEFAPAFVRAAKALESPLRNRSVKVDTKNGGSYNYKYATLDRVTDLIREKAGEQGLGLFQPIITAANGTRWLLTHILHESGQWRETEWQIADGDIKTQAGDITYKRRLAAQAAFGISAEEDTDASLASGDRMRERGGNADRAAARQDRRENATDINDSEARHLVQRARLCTNVEDAVDLLERWNRGRSHIEKLRRTPDWEPMVRSITAGLRVALGDGSSWLFRGAVQMIKPEDIATLDQALEKADDWLAIMKDEAPAAHSALMGAINQQKDRVRAAAGQQTEKPDGETMTDVAKGVQRRKDGEPDPPQDPQTIRLYAAVGGEFWNVAGSAKAPVQQRWLQGWKQQAARLPTKARAEEWLQLHRAEVQDPECPPPLPQVASLWPKVEDAAMEAYRAKLAELDGGFPGDQPSATGN